MTNVENDKIEYTCVSRNEEEEEIDKSKKELRKKTNREQELHTLASLCKLIDANSIFYAHILTFMDYKIDIIYAYTYDSFQ